MQARPPRCDEFETALATLDSSNDSIPYAPGHARDARRAMSHLISQSSVGEL
jgi:hypothetical protein